MKRYIIDMGTPKEVRFFKPICEELIRRGNAVILTTRDNQESISLIKHFGMPAIIAGKFGDTRENKLLYGIERMEKLFPLFTNFKPDGLITLSEPNIIRLAFGLGIPIYNFIDIPEAEKVCKLTLPLATWNFIPFFVPRHTMNNLGAQQIYIYQCMDPNAWLTPNPGELDKEFRFKDGKPFIIWRRGEVTASYYKDSGFKDITPLIADRLQKLHPKWHFYEIPRYKTHKIVNLPAVLKEADVFIGGGGTIQIESCYYGTWTMTTRPFKTYYDDYLVSEQMMNRVSTVEAGVELAEKWSLQPRKNPTAKTLQAMKFPIEEICDKIECGE